MQPMRSGTEPDNDKDNESEVLDDFLGATVISPSSWWKKRSTWHIGRDDRLKMPSSLEILLDDYNLALGVESPNAKLIRPRLDSILIQTLSVVKEARQSYIVGCTIDYALWYGSRQDLETNFIVHRSDVLMEDECWTPLAAMSIIHYARKKTGRNAEIYGICTDSYKWTFLHLNSKSQLDWTKGQQEEIVSQIGKIIKQEIEIAVSEAQMNRRKMTSKADIDIAPVVPRTVAQKGKKPVTSERQDLPHISIADIRPQDVRAFLRIQPDGNFSARWQLTAQDKVQGPEYLGSILSGYWRAAGRDSENKALMRSRLETILVAVLASKKRESASAYGSLHLQFEKNLTMLHHARTRAGRNDTIVYGIVTDTDEWRFLCIDKQSRYSGCIMSWDKGQQVDIISTIYKILNHAAALAQALEAPSLTEYSSVEDASGLEWSD
ncbi:hypothetical protein IFM51744_09627 [Aspergillus udagawae]|nr:hypothetical protein IFM51744_09627 [Aspergillus udagawae]